MSRLNLFSAVALRAYAALAVTVSLTACVLEEATLPVANAPEVQVAAPIIQTVPASLQFPAMLEAVDRVALHARVSGYLDSIDFEEGKLVGQGDVLFRIDARTYLARLADAQAALATARAEFQLAQSEAERADRLRERQAISAEEAERRLAHATIAQAQVLAAQAQVKTAELDVEFSTIRAPFSGRIGRAKVARGTLVTPEDELGVLVAMDELLVRFDVDENAFASLGEQDREEWFVRFLANGLETTGPVTIVESEVKPGTGTVRMFARIQNTDHMLLPGMFGEASLVYGVHEDAVLIDDKAVGTKQGQRFVLVANQSNVLDYRPVKIGASFGELRSVVSGLGPTDRVVINGLMRVRPGAEVTPVEVSMPLVAGTALPSRSIASSH